MWLTDLQAQATKFKVDLMLGLGEDKTPTPLSKAEAAARYIAGTPLRGDGQREISAERRGGQLREEEGSQGTAVLAQAMGFT